MPVAKKTKTKQLIVEETSQEEQAVENSEDEKFWEEENSPRNTAAQPQTQELDNEPQELDFLKDSGKSGRNGRGTRFLWTVIIVIFIVGGIAVGLFTFREGVAKIAGFGQEATPIPTPEATQIPAPTPEPDRSGLVLQILNGSGTPGLGKKVESFLENLGYKVENVGNAKSFTYDKTEISVKESKKEYIDILIKDLSEDYEVDEEAKTLDEDSKFDAVIIIGKQ